MTLNAVISLNAALRRTTYQGAYGPSVNNVVFRKDKESGRYVTVVHFADGVKSVVKQCENDQFDLEKAILWAIVKRIYGKVEVVEKNGKKVLELSGNGYAAAVKKLVDTAVDQGKKQEDDAAKKAAAKKPDSAPATDVTKSEKPAATAKRYYVSKARGKIRVARLGRNVLSTSPVAKLRKSLKQMTNEEKREYWRWAKRRQANRKTVQAKKQAR